MKKLYVVSEISFSYEPARLLWKRALVSILPTTNSWLFLPSFLPLNKQAWNEEKQKVVSEEEKRRKRDCEIASVVCESSPRSSSTFLFLVLG